MRGAIEDNFSGLLASYYFASCYMVFGIETEEV